MKQMEIAKGLKTVGFKKMLNQATTIYTNVLRILWEEPHIPRTAKKYERKFGKNASTNFIVLSS